VCCSVGSDLFVTPRLLVRVEDMMIPLTATGVAMRVGDVFLRAHFCDNVRGMAARSGSVASIGG